MYRSLSFMLLLAGCGGYVPFQLDPGGEPPTPLELPVLANAGADREILRGFQAFLDGRATHHPQSVSFEVEWEQIAGEPVYLSNAMDVRPSFAAPLDEQELVFQLTATDGRFTTRDQVHLHVKHAPRQLAPRVRAGPDRYLDAGQRREAEENDILEGLANDVITSWERILPERVNNDSSTRDADNDAPAVFRLLGARDGLESAPDYLILHPFRVERTGERAPVASIEAETSVAPGANVELDASGTTDANGDSISYRWEQTAGTPVAVTGHKKLIFEAPRRREELSFRVFARDALLESAPAKISIVVGAGAGDDLPVVVGSDRRARPDRFVSLDALGDPGATVTATTSFVWNQSVGAPVDFETESEGRFIYFIAPQAPDELAFSVFAANEVIDGPPAVARVTVVKEDENLPPNVYLSPSTSDPSPGQEVSVTARIHDPEHDSILGCTWSTEVDPAGRVVNLDPGELCSPDADGEVVVYFLAPPAGTTVTLMLTVIDEFQAESTAAVDITSTY